MKYHLLFFFIVCTEVLFALNVNPDLPNKKNKELLFIENKGQITDFDGTPRHDILFILKAEGVNIFVCKNSLHYVFSKCNQPELLQKTFENNKLPTKENEITNSEITYTTYRLDLFLQGANPNATLKTAEPKAYYENYYNVPTHPEGIIGVKSFDKITIENIYLGIDWVLYIKEGKLKYDLVVHQGADYRQIKMQYNGANEIKLNPDGSLLVNTPLGSITEDNPYTYSIVDQKEIPSSFRVNGNIINFDINIDKSINFIIDPGLQWATYYGGDNHDGGTAVCSDDSNNVYMTGTANSTNGISKGGHQNNYRGNEDAFIVKFNSNGTRQWATYYGGTAEDEGRGLATDMDENVYVAGYTSSTTGISSGGHQNSFGVGYTSAYLVKFNSNGTRQWGTYYGDTASTYGYAVTTDKSGNIYLAGNTTAESRISSNGHQNTFGGNIFGGDAFIVKFNKSGTRLWATYYGGGDQESGKSLATDNSENVYLAGWTYSPNGISSNGHKNTLNGSATTDAFLVKFNKNGIRIWGTYYGGTSWEWGANVAIDGFDVYLAGYTNSANDISSGGHQTTIGGDNDAFLVKFSSSGVRQWATYYGGANFENLGSMYANNGNIYITGETNSTNAISYKGYKTTYSGGSDVFLACFNSNGKREWGTYYGGTKDENVWGLTTDKQANIYICGSTLSPSGIAFNGFLNSLNGPNYYDAFLAKFYPKNVILNIADNNTLCFGDSILLRYNKTIKMNYGNTYTFQISDSAGSFVSPTTIFSKTDSASGIDSFKIFFSNHPSGSSNLKLRVITSSPVDTIYFDQKFIINPRPVASFSILDSAQCLTSNKFVFTNSSSIYSGTINYKWGLGDGTISDSISVAKSYSLAGNYTVKLVATSGNGCKDSLLKAITVYPQPLVGFTVNNDTQCLRGNNFNFTNSSSVSSGFLNYVWQYGDADSSTSYSPTHKYRDTGNYTIILKAISDKNCLDSISKTIYINGHPEAVINVIQNNVCFGDTAVFDVKNPVTQNKVQWLRNGVANTSDSLIRLKSNFSGNLQLVLVNNNGCKDTSATQNIVVYLKPVKPILSQSSFMLDAGMGYSTYLWHKNGQPISNSTTQTYNVTQNGSYHVLVTNNEGCQEWSDTISVTNVSVNEMINQDELNIYPNPSTGVFTLDFASIAPMKRVYLYDTKGNILYQQLTHENSLLLNVQHLPKGVYIVKILSEEDIYFSKLIIE